MDLKGRKGFLSHKEHMYSNANTFLPCGTEPINIEDPGQIIERKLSLGSLV